VSFAYFQEILGNGLVQAQNSICAYRSIAYIQFSRIH
jgi:hypothetical protein